MVLLYILLIPILGAVVILAIKPIKVLSPVAKTIPNADPSMQTHELNATFFASITKALWGSIDISIASTSPVKLDYSTFNPLF